LPLAGSVKSGLKSEENPVFRHLPPTQIDTSLVMKVLAPIWPAKPETASRIRGGAVAPARTHQPCKWAFDAVRTGEFC